MSIVQSKITRAPGSSLSTFHLFAQLPQELQVMIWKFALPRMRIIQGFPDDETVTLINLPQQRDPSMLKVNRQSRNEALRLFQKRAQPSNGVVYFSSSFDILYLDLFHHLRKRIACPKADRWGISVQELDKGEHIALRLRAASRLYHTGLEFFISYLTMLWTTSSLLEVTIVVDDRDDEVEHPWLRDAVSYAARVASEKVLSWKKSDGVFWKHPNVELVTKSYFEVHFVAKAMEHYWPVPLIENIEPYSRNSDCILEYGETEYTCEAESKTFVNDGSSSSNLIATDDDELLSSPQLSYQGGLNESLVVACHSPDASDDDEMPKLTQFNWVKLNQSRVEVSDSSDVSDYDKSPEPPQLSEVYSSPNTSDDDELPVSPQFSRETSCESLADARYSSDVQSSIAIPHRGK
ncbi:hypothetical protein VTL71DRAFT_6709 [Oculimacula yallundae]|uniref:2EXR domain-containing protein n=1 Tax=Oculimacula yallundae TaxID=86028 RepID=A0ABR4BXS1_9HELO